MKLWLANKWENLRDSFWFLPALMVLAAIGLAWGMIELDQRLADDGMPGWLSTRGPEGSRALLSAVAASMMTIVSITFSITIVTLQLASSQFGPRLLRNFMSDRGNQVAIGAFIATFAYCLIVLRSVNGSENDTFVPHAAVAMGMALALISLGVLIFFIHHMAESIQAEAVITAVSVELDYAIERLYPEELGQGPAAAEQLDDAGANDRSLPEGFDQDAAAIASPRSDYLQAVDVERLMEFAVEHDLVLSLGERPGKFCIAGNQIVRAWPAERIDADVARAIQNCFYFGRRRTITQDVEFAVDQLVEVAVRALSPGINDPFTAVNCVDRLGAALCKLDQREFPSPYRCDEDGRLRVVVESSSLGGVVDAAFDQIRQAASRNVAVTLRLLETLQSAARHARHDDFRAALRRQAEAIEQTLDGPPDGKDQRDIAERSRAVYAALDEMSPRERAPTDDDSDDRQ